MVREDGEVARFQHVAEMFQDFVDSQQWYPITISKRWNVETNLLLQFFILLEIQLRFVIL
jgi:hypothetical protein